MVKNIDLNGRGYVYLPEKGVTKLIKGNAPVVEADFLKALGAAIQQRDELDEAITNMKKILMEES